MKVSAMKTYKDFIIYKGQDKEVQIPFAVSGFTDFNASFYTDKEYEVLKDASDFDFDGEWASIFFDNTDLDLLNDGILRYTFTYKIDGVDVVKSTNSAYALRTPENYSAHTADAIYASGHTAGMEDQKELMIDVNISENGTYTRPDGYSSVDVAVDQVGPYNSGYTSGYTDGHESGVTEVENTIQENSTQNLNFWYNEYGPDEGYESMKKITLNVQEFYQDAFIAGRNDQKSMLTAITITENGFYEKMDGYNPVTVAVDQVGPYNSGYTSGYTDGMVSGTSVGYDEGFAEGESTQKAKLIAVTISGNGEYYREDGYNELIVNVPTTVNNQNKSITAITNGHQVITFDQDYTGLGTVDVEVAVDQVGPYNSGYTSGCTDGFGSGYTSGHTDGYSSGFTDGFGSGYTSGHTDGYSSGFTDGYVSGSTSGFGKVADMTGVGFRVPYSDGTLIEFEFMCPIFDGEYSGETLFVASHGGYDSLGYDNGGSSILCKYDTTTVGNVGKNIIATQYFAPGFTVAGYGSKDYFVRILGTMEDVNNVTALAKGVTSVGQGSGISTQLHDGWISMFAMRNVLGTDIMPGTLPRYFKRLKIYNHSLSQGGTLVNDIVPRSDGKMWDLVTNQEANIVWEKYDGTYPTVFNTLYEWDIP